VLDSSLGLHRFLATRHLGGRRHQDLGQVLCPVAERLRLLLRRASAQSPPRASRTRIDLRLGSSPTSDVAARHSSISRKRQYCASHCRRSTFIDRSPHENILGHPRPLAETCHLQQARTSPKECKQTWWLRGKHTPSYLTLTPPLYSMCCTCTNAFRPSSCRSPPRSQFPLPRSDAQSAHRPHAVDTSSCPHSPRRLAHLPRDHRDDHNSQQNRRQRHTHTSGHRTCPAFPILLERPA
jgi:hypothetical protein